MKCLKKGFGIFLALALLMSSMGIGLGMKIEKADLSERESVSKTTPSFAVTFYVPEVIYLTPSLGSTSTFQYYVDCNTDGSLDNTRNKGTGTVYFYCAAATATNVSISVTGGSVSSWSMTTQNANTFSGTINSGSVTTSQAQGVESYLTWTATYYVNGEAKTATAYTCVYAPYCKPVGAAARFNNSYGTDNFAQAVSWISGVHGYSVATRGGNYDPKTASNSLYSLGASVTAPTAGSHTGVAAWLTALANGSIGYQSHDASDDGTLYSNSPHGLLTVDTSRYGNMNQIPNFTTGFMVTDDENNSACTSYLVDFTDRSHDGNGFNGDNNNVWSERDDRPSTHVDGSAAPWSVRQENIRYNGTWTRAISGSGNQELRVKGLLLAEQSGDEAQVSTCTYLTLTKTDKSALRTAVRLYTSYGLQAADYPSGTWATYTYELAYASQRLTNMKYSADVSTTNLVNAYNALVKNTYSATITHTSADGFVSASEPLTFSSSDTVSFGPNSYTGYTLSSASGYTTSTSAQTVYNRRANISETYTYSPITYTVAYNGNGYTGGTTASSSHTYNTAKALTTNGYSRTGYTFTGWNTAANGSGTSYTNGQSVTNLSSAQGATVTLYAQWSINSYNLTFDANGGTGGTGPTSTQYNAAISAPAVSRAGYTLTGWSPSVPATMPAANTTYTAQWSANTNTVYHVNHYKVNVPVNGWDYDSTDTLYGTTGTTVTAPVNSYPGFYVSDEGLTVHQGVIAGDGSLVLTRYYRRYYYNITFNASGGSGGAGATSMIYGGSLSAPSPGTRTGYTFTGWSPSVPSTVGVGDATYTAQWSINTYYVIFDANGGSGSMSNQGIQYGSSAALTANAFSRTGYTFTGWNTAANGSGTAYANQASYGPIGAGNVTLYAQWSINTYYVQFNGNGSTGGSMSNQGIVYGQSAALTANAFSRTGYTFTGWNTAANGSGTAYANQASYGPIGAGNVTLYAQWSINTYYVQFNGNGSTGGSMSNQGIVYGQSAALTANAFSRTGYAFTGWNTAANGSGTAYANQAIYGPIGAGNITLYAQWSINAYTITFNGNGGTTPSPITQNYGTTVTAPANPTRTGYTFTGWSPAVPPVMPAENMECVAQWSINTYYVQFNANGGSGSMSNQGIVYGQSAALTANAFARTGYTFTGWNTVSNGSGTPYTNQASYGPIGAGNVTLYAQWSINTYYVQFNANSGSGSMSNQGIVYGQSANLTANAFTRTGYTFTGWNTASNGSGTPYANGASYGPIGAANVTLYAQWSINAYTITFNGNGGTTPSAITQNYGTTVTAPANPTRTGYTFTGWSPAVPPVMPAENIECVAQWSINTYYIQFNANGGSGSMSNQSIVYGQSAALTANAFTRTGYTFTGWNTVSNGSGTPYANQASYGPIGAGNVTLYAQWSVNSYTITFDANGGTGGWSQSLVYASTLTPPAVTRTGYTFTGWSPSPPPTVPAGNSTYTAQWSINSYTISFDEQGGTTVADITQNYATAVTAPVNPTKTGYTFTGWSPAVPPAMPANNMTCVAQWTINSYTISFDEQGGTTVADIMQNYATAVTTPANPTKTGYTFVGWSPAVPVTMPANNTTCVAQWAANTYTVTYNGNGSDAGSTADSSHTYDAAGSLTSNGFTKTGYSFLGWSTNSGAVTAEYTDGQSVLNLTTGNGDIITFYGVWAIGSYLIIFDANGGTGGWSQSLTYNSTLTPPTVTRTGYTFSSWSPVPPAAVPAASTTYTAQWEAGSYTVTFNANGGSVSPASKNVTYDSTYGTLPTPNYEGYSFNGWFTSANGGTQMTNATAVAIIAPQTLYAQWTMIPADYETLDEVVTFEFSAGDLGTAQILDGLGQDQGSVYLYGNASQRQAVSDAYDDALAVQALAPLADTAYNRALIAAAATALSDAIDTLLANPNPAVYTYVDAEITQANQINLNRYTMASIDELQTAVDSVVAGKPAAQQSTVNGYTAALYSQRAGSGALVPYQDNKAPKISVMETAKTMQDSGLSIPGFDPDDYGDVSYVFPGKGWQTYYCYTNSENPAILINIEDITDSNGRVSYPANLDITRKSGTVNPGFMNFTYDSDAGRAGFSQGTVTAANPYSGYTVGMEYDALGSDYYRQSGYILLKPEFTQSYNNKQFAVYTISGADDASETGNIADKTSLAGGTVVYQNGVPITTANTNWTPVNTITVFVEYRNSMSNENGEYYEDGRAVNSFKAYNTLGADDTWVNRDYFYRISAGATNDEIIKRNDTVYNANDPTFGQKNLACFYYVLDADRDASIISTYGDGSGGLAATDLLKQAIAADVGGVYSSNTVAWPNTAWSLQHVIKSPSRLVFVHLVDRWGNVFNKIIKINNVDYEYPSFADITYGTVTLNESGGSGITLLKLYQYAYEGSPQFVVPCYSDKLIETINVINEPDNVLDVSVGQATVVDGVQNRFTLYTKDKAGNEKTQTVFTDAAGNLSVTVNDPDNMSPPQQKSAGAKAMSEPAVNIYTFLLNDTITVNLNNPTQAEAYTITFNLNGGTSVTIDPITQDEGATVTPPADPTREGFVFAGWLPEVPETMPAENTECVAQWTMVEDPALVSVEGSTTVIDDTHQFIYGLTEGITLEVFESLFVEVLGEGRLEITPVIENYMGTGTKVELISNLTDGVVATYYIVIFGDVSGDSLVDSNDADIIVNYSNFAIEWDIETEPYLFFASDLNKDTISDIVDSDIIINYQNFAMWIDQTTGLAYAY